MKIILDECLPHRLAKELSGHEVKTVQKMGWSKKTNGELLALIAEPEAAKSLSPASRNTASSC